MAFSFFFYDLETSGVDSRRARIMQFAGQRTDEHLKPIGAPYNILVKLTEDTLPDPDAVLITGITPQKTLEEGITEAEFCKIFQEEISRPGTCFTGFNNIRFDDEFMRFLLYRNFYDPYEWQWRDGRSRWDLLDVTRMTRALRPDGIKWPFTAEGVCTNKLELLSKENGLVHEMAHDALSDVNATIAVAQMVKQHQPDLFDYLFSIRGKKDVIALVSKGQPVVYASGRYTSDHLKATVAYPMGSHPEKQGYLMYDLRHDPETFLKMDVKELAECWKYNPDKEAIRLPVKSMQFNRAPALAPLGVLDKASQERLELDLETVQKHKAKIDTDKGFYERLRDAVDYMNKLRSDKTTAFSELQEPDEQLYDEFINDYDKKIAAGIVAAPPDEISQAAEKLRDKRLQKLVPLYKARNFPKALTGEEREAWEEHRRHRLLSGGEDSAYAKFGQRLAELSSEKTDKNTQYLLEELRLYGESIVPEM